MRGEDFLVRLAAIDDWADVTQDWYHQLPASVEVDALHARQIAALDQPVTRWDGWEAELPDNYAKPIGELPPLGDGCHDVDLFLRRGRTPVDYHIWRRQIGPNRKRGQKRAKPEPVTRRKRVLEWKSGTGIVL